MAKVEFEKGSVSEAQREAIKNMIAERVDSWFVAMQTRISEQLQTYKDGLKKQLMYEIEDFLTGDFAILMGDDENE